jgi:hypothetical protein
VIALTIGEIRHLGNMMIPDDSAKSRQIGVIDQQDATVIPTPNELSLFGLEIILTKYAIRHTKNVNENGI